MNSGASGGGQMSGDPWQTPGQAQPPQFSASDLISPDSLPGWMRQGPIPQSGPGRSQAPEPSWGQQAPPAAPAWGTPPVGQPAPLEALQTVRQPAVAPSPMPYQAPAPAASQQGWAAAPQPYPQQFAPAPQSPQIPQSPMTPYGGQAQPPSAAGYPSLPAYPPGGAINPGGAFPGTPQSGWTPQTPPAAGSYSQNPYPQQAPAQPAYSPPSAFPSVEHAGMFGALPPAAGIGAHGLVDQGALPSWLAGAAPPPQPQTLGMQARSLVDEQLLPEWLRQQPEERPKPTVASWLGASAAEEQPPAWMTPAAAESARPSPAAPAFPQAFGAQPQVAPSTPWNAPQLAQPGQNPWQQPQPTPNAWQARSQEASSALPGSEDLALPDWLQRQASAAPEPAPFAMEAARPVSYDLSGAAPFLEFPDQSDFERPFASEQSPKWDRGQASDERAAGPQAEWRQPDSWGDEAHESAASDGWDQPLEQPVVRGGPKKLTRGAPLAPDEMPAWLRRATAEPSFASQRDAFSYDEQSGRSAPQRHGGGRADGWDDAPQVWDDGAYGAGDNGYGAQDDGWQDPYGTAVPRRAGGVWDDSPQEDYADNSRVGPNEQWRQGREPAQPYDGYYEDAPGQYARDPYPDDGYGEYANEERYPAAGSGYGDGDDYYDAEDAQERRRKGWRSFFRRDE